MHLGDVLALGLGLVLLVGGAAKLRDPAGFAAAVLAYDLVPGRLVAAVSRALPVAEIAAALLAILPQTRGAGLVVVGLLLAAMTAAVVVNLLRGRTNLDCGCGGLGGRQPISWWLVARNAVLIAATLVAAIAPLPPVDVVGGVAAGLALLLLSAAIDRLLANHLVVRSSMAAR